MSPQKLSCDKFSTGTLDLIHKSVFLLNFWGESCLSTVLTKEDSFDSGILSTLKLGDDATISQSNARRREDNF